MTDEEYNNWFKVPYPKGGDEVTIYTLETKDPTFDGVTQEATIINSWSRGMLKLTRLSPMGIVVILVHPWLAKDQRSFEDAWRYKEKYKAQTVIVGELKERKEIA